MVMVALVASRCEQWMGGRDVRVSMGGRNVRVSMGAMVAAMLAVGVPTVGVQSCRCRNF